MAFRRILKYPDKKLRLKSLPVVDFDDSVNSLVRDLWDTLNVAGGAGLSAPQIGVHKRVIYISCGGFKSEMVNPTIVSADNLVSMTEGCLSFPGVSERLARYNNVTVSYFDTDGKNHTADLSGIAAQAVQHEVEHLDGKLMLDHFSSIKRNRIVKKTKKVIDKANAIMHPPEDAQPKRVKKNSHLSKKELKKRKDNRQRSRKKR